MLKKKSNMKKPLPKFVGLLIDLLALFFINKHLDSGNFIIQDFDVSRKLPLLSKSFSVCDFCSSCYISMHLSLNAFNSSNNDKSLNF